VRSTPYLRHVSETWHIWCNVAEQALVEAERPSNASSFGARLNIQQLSQSSRYITFKDESSRTRVDRSHIGGGIGTSGGRSTPKTQFGSPICRFAASNSPSRRSLVVPRKCHVRVIRSVATAADDAAWKEPRSLAARSRDALAHPTVAQWAGSGGGSRLNPLPERYQLAMRKQPVGRSNSGERGGNEGWGRECRVRNHWARAAPQMTVITPTLCKEVV